MSNLSDLQPETAVASEQGKQVDSARFTKWDVWISVALVGMVPMLMFVLPSLWSLSYLRFFPLVIVVLAYFAFRGWRAHETTHPVRWYSSFTMLLLATLIYIVAVWKLSPWLAQLSMILLFLAWALGRCGHIPWPAILAWTGLLLTTLRLPFNWDAGFLEWLQLNSAWACSKALDALGIPNFHQGSTIQIRYSLLNVAEACGQIGSLYAICAISILISILTHRSCLVSLLSLLTVPGWEIFRNFVQLMVIALAQEYYGRDLAHGNDHWVLTISTFVLTIGCYWLAERFIANMLHPVPAAEQEFAIVFQTYNKLFVWPQLDPFEALEPEDEEDRKQLRAIKAYIESTRWKWLPMHWTEARWLVRAIKLCALLIVLVGIAPAVLLLLSGNSLALLTPSFETQQLGDFPKLESLPDEFGSWKKLGFEHEQRTTASQFGQHSLTWKYLWTDQIVSISLDFPFDTWRPLSASYRHAGWTIQSNRLVEAEPAEQTGPREEIVMTNELGGLSYAYGTAFTDDLQPFVPVAGTSATDSESSGGILGAFKRTDASVSKVTYQIRMFCEPGSELPEERRAELEAQFREFRRLILEAAAPAVRALAGRSGAK